MQVCTQSDELAHCQSDQDLRSFHLAAPVVLIMQRIRQSHPTDMCAKCVTYPATSRVISRTKAVRFDRKPFLREIRGAGVLGVTSVCRCQIASLAQSGSSSCGEYVLWPALRPTMRPGKCQYTAHW